MSQFWFEFRVLAAGLGIGFLAGLVAGVLLTVLALAGVSVIQRF